MTWRARIEANLEIKKKKKNFSQKIQNYQFVPFEYIFEIPINKNQIFVMHKYFFDILKLQQKVDL